MMLAEADEIDTHCVGEDGLLDDVADDLRVGLGISIHPNGNVAEGVEAEFEKIAQGSLFSFKMRVVAPRAASIHIEIVISSRISASGGCTSCGAGRH
jgi:hypothetical protein